jgi:hypothetical protein
MRNAFSLAAVLAGLLAIAGSARADQLLNSDFNLQGGGVGGAPVGQQFTLTQSVTVTDIIANLSTIGVSTSATMSIDSDSSGTIGSTVYGTSGSQTVLNTGNYDFTFSTPVTLGPGTYWAVQSHTGFSDFWTEQKPGMSDTSSYGSINQSYYASGYDTNAALAMQVNGSASPAAVPEPASIVLCGIAAAAVGSARAWARRKRAAIA